MTKRVGESNITRRQKKKRNTEKIIESKREKRGKGGKEKIGKA